MDQDPASLNTNDEKEATTLEDKKFVVKNQDCEIIIDKPQLPDDTKKFMGKPGDSKKKLAETNSAVSHSGTNDFGQLDGIQQGLKEGQLGPIGTFANAGASVNQATYHEIQKPTPLAPSCDQFQVDDEVSLEHFFPFFLCDYHSLTLRFSPFVRSIRVIHLILKMLLTDWFQSSSAIPHSQL